MEWTKQQIQEVWEKGRTASNNDPAEWRKDVCGAWMQRDQYGKEGDFGWEIDHIYPESRAPKHPHIHDLANLRPMQHENNGSKGNSYPYYTSVIRADGIKNFKAKVPMTVNEALRNTLAKLFGKDYREDKKA